MTISGLIQSIETDDKDKNVRNLYLILIWVAYREDVSTNNTFISPMTSTGKLNEVE